MDNVSPRPWESWVTGIDDANGRKVLWNTEHTRMSVENQLHIIKCVNEYEKLLGENSHLKKLNNTLEVEVDQLSREVEELKKEVSNLTHKLKKTNELRDLDIKDSVILFNERNQLKEALKKCNSIDYDCGYCIFCDGGYKKHKENCEYIKLTK